MTIPQICKASEGIDACVSTEKDLSPVPSLCTSGADSINMPSSAHSIRISYTSTQNIEESSGEFYYQIFIIINNFVIALHT